MGALHAGWNRVLRDLGSSNHRIVVLNAEADVTSGRRFGVVVLPARGHAGGAGTRMPLAETRQVAVCIGPEHGTVAPTLVREAAKEAPKSYGFDVLVVCGFAFDTHAGEAVKEFATSASDDRLAAEEILLRKLSVLLMRMNPTLAG